MQKTRVSQGTKKMHKLLSRRKLPRVRRLILVYRDRVTCGAMLLSLKRRKNQRKDGWNLGSYDRCLNFV